MRIGIISDIHNNVVALNKILEVFEKNKCKIIICAGDIIGIGPYPEETVQQLLRIENVLAVQGNHESYLSDGMNKEKMSVSEYNYHIWEHEILSNSSKSFVNGLSKELYKNINGRTIYISHYGLTDSGFKNFIRKPTLSELDLLFQDIDADVIIYGHDHAPSQLKGRAFYINPGSCGCPGKTKNIARAGILELSDSITYQQISIEYDVDIVLNRIDEIAYPAMEEIKKFFFGRD